MLKRGRRHFERGRTERERDAEEEKRIQAQVREMLKERASGRAGSGAPESNFKDAALYWFGVGSGALHVDRTTGLTPENAFYRATAIHTARVQSGAETDEGGKRVKREHEDHETQTP